ncbi:hypothetical protein C8Q75DRAFT_805654 [Abortiporus biennis]|nr:hypothetical protein C8Q75DRAFT_805654 [Abortiporus biennis]
MRSTMMLAVVCLITAVASAPVDIESRANGNNIYNGTPGQPLVNPPGSNVAPNGVDSITPNRFGRPGQNVASRPAGPARGGSIYNTGSSITNTGANFAGNGADSRSGNVVAH